MLCFWAGTRVFFSLLSPSDELVAALDWQESKKKITIGNWETIKKGNKIAILAVGSMVREAEKALINKTCLLYTSDAADEG